MNGSSMQPGDKQTLKLLAFLIGSLLLLMVALIGIAFSIQKGQQMRSRLEAQLILGEDLIAQNMDMEVEDSLSRVGAIVDDGTEGIANTQLLCHHAYSGHEMAKQFLVFIPGVHETRNGLARDQEHMDRSFWGNVLDANANVIFIDYLGGNLPLDDLGKQRFF